MAWHLGTGGAAKAKPKAPLTSGRAPLHEYESMRCGQDNATEYWYGAGNETFLEIGMLLGGSRAV